MSITAMVSSPSHGSVGHSCFLFDSIPAIRMTVAEVNRYKNNYC